MTMKTQETAAAQQANPDLLTLYRPLGLKAVLAAHLMLKKSTPPKKTRA